MQRLVSTRPDRDFCQRGFTLVELLVTLALVGVAAVVVLPMASLVEQRAKEAELRQALRVLRTAIDEYKTAADAGLIAKRTGASGYPPDLDTLVKGAPRTSTFGFNSSAMVFLRSIPRDPFHSDKTVPASRTWDLRRYGAQAGDHAPGDDVFDVSSRADGQALDGSWLRDW
ncbi:type II secretion system protein [Hydrogenophaga sp. T2]|uniref:type II secretion system protein n=1 Tax=Hydrogenophaga sp. T2 TaxID=3132823 RepID=UPI003CF4D037